MTSYDDTCSVSIHIGNIIREHVSKLGITKSELARRINTTSQNIHGIFTRKSIDTDLLLKISKAIKVNLFSYYESLLKDLPDAKNTDIIISRIENLEKEITTLKKKKR